MHKVISMVFFGAGLLAAAPASANVPWWVNVGPNFAHADDADRNCLGGQTGLTVGSRLMVRGQVASVSYEDQDDGKDCDLGLAGDSASTERALMVGLATDGGLFVAAGPSDVHGTIAGGTDRGEDTGTRVELGFSSRLHTRRVAGFEVVLFRTENEVRDHAGLAINWTFGPGRGGKAPAATRGSGRY